jgi:heme exporter protein A
VIAAAASEGPPLLLATSLERRFGVHRALRGVSLSVRPGECHLVVGPNGAGKSTLLRLLAGLARPSAGTIALDGEALTGAPTLRQSVGLLSHQSHLYDDLSALENLAFAARLHRLAGDPTGMARRRLAALGLTERLDEPVRTLSRGTVQRLAIARALLHGPRLLLLDEPFTGLDPAATDHVADLLAAERRAGKGLVLVSHDVHESWELATHVHVLVRGLWTIDEPKSGSLEEFLRRYREALHG